MRIKYVKPKTSGTYLWVAGESSADGSNYILKIDPSTMGIKAAVQVNPTANHFNVYVLKYKKKLYVSASNYNNDQPSAAGIYDPVILYVYDLNLNLINSYYGIYQGQPYNLDTDGTYIFQTVGVDAAHAIMGTYTTDFDEYDMDGNYIETIPTGNQYCCLFDVMPLNGYLYTYASAPIYIYKYSYTGKQIALSNFNYQNFNNNGLPSAANLDTDGTYIYIAMPTSGTGAGNYPVIKFDQNLNVLAYANYPPNMGSASTSNIFVVGKNIYVGFTTTSGTQLAVYDSSDLSLISYTGALKSSNITQVVWLNKKLYCINGTNPAAIEVVDPTTLESLSFTTYNYDFTGRAWAFPFRGYQLNYP
ncbi:hypothetical protein [Metallosphaera sp.]|uniref:hypothetical protein n=1 Tax=Metallosphaera sp. TaxID=2020860 RepID=UPI00316B4CAA